ncbi:type II toxin-antitoxin system VapC family toxin [Spirosoma validum]|uniref:Type II toxin-antitoxin system VapC family toxin n=1 Tax=Spirosoma validum TaxID=2771355 RepID=A0A927B1D6_9BACT|nr:type II toxin-antitoxin system VapC family toxin [Spirosoma validum]MBD2753628.1 type II toxin-antitoxin system VapC family toxin [Spirosoma validum]
MNLLLDTHTLIWYLEGNLQLSQTCQNLIENPSNTNFVSIASFWEIAIKLSISGKLELSQPFDQLNRIVWENNITTLPIRFEHTALVRSLPFYHKDPFDRIIIAQSILDDMAVLSRDGHFDAYSIRRFWYN